MRRSSWCVPSFASGSIVFWVCCRFRNFEDSGSRKKGPFSKLHHTYRGSCSSLQQEQSILVQPPLKIDQFVSRLQLGCRHTPFVLGGRSVRPDRFKQCLNCFEYGNLGRTHHIYRERWWCKKPRLHELLILPLFPYYYRPHWTPIHGMAWDDG